MEGFLPQRRLQPVGDVAEHLLTELDRMLADRAIEGETPLDRLGRGRVAAGHLDQWDQMRRVERMAEHDALGMMGTGILELADGDAGGAGRQDRVRGRRGIQPAKQIALQVQALGSVLLHKLRVCNRRLK